MFRCIGDSKEKLHFTVRRTHEYAKGIGIFLILPSFLQKPRGKSFSIHIHDVDVYILFTFKGKKMSSVYVLADPRHVSKRKTQLRVDKRVGSVESLFRLGLPSPTSKDGLVSPPELNASHSSTSTTGT